jgi:hypothetical protein
MILSMCSDTNPTGGVPPEFTADCEAVIEHVLYRRPLDSNAYRRVRERSQRVTEEIRRSRSVVNIAVQLIRETRAEN